MLLLKAWSFLDQESIGTPVLHGTQIENHGDQAQACAMIISYGSRVLKWGLREIFSNCAQDKEEVC